MAEPKTRPTGASVEEFLAAIDNQRRRDDAIALDAIMRSISGYEPAMWGQSIVGYGEMALANGRSTSTTWPIVAFSPRKSDLVLYIDTAIEDAYFEGLGPHRRGVSCLYLKRLADTVERILRDLISRSVEISMGPRPTAEV